MGTRTSGFWGSHGNYAMREIPKISLGHTSDQKLISDEPKRLHNVEAITYVI